MRSMDFQGPRTWRIPPKRELQQPGRNLYDTPHGLAHRPEPGPSFVCVCPQAHSSDVTLTGVEQLRSTSARTHEICPRSLHKVSKQVTASTSSRFLYRGYLVSSMPSRQASADMGMVRAPPWMPGGRTGLVCYKEARGMMALGTGRGWRR